MSTFTLLIWEEVPENVSLYLIPNDDLTPEDVGILHKAHNNYINSVHTVARAGHALDAISNALCENPKYLGDEHPIGSRYACAWGKYKQSPDLPIQNTMITSVIRCGFLL